MMSIQWVLVQLVALFLSLTRISSTTPITTGPENNNPALIQALPQCPIFNSDAFPNKTHDDPSTLSPRAIIQRVVTIRAADPRIVNCFFYCPDLLIKREAATRTLYGALRALTPRLNSEGANAPLGRPFVTEQERGINCVFSISDHDGGGEISVGVVIHVIRWFREYMLEGNHLGSMTFVIYMDHMKVATGQMRPRVDTPRLVRSS
ncbi:MAG: hypothetical protein Q9182_004619 [Xanthomendoza sp. 2 TL-2023]